MHFCVTCGIKFNTNVFLICPNCFKVRCRDCSHREPWKHSYFRCPACLSLKYDVLETKAKNDELIEKLRPKDRDDKIKGT